MVHRYMLSKLERLSHEKFKKIRQTRKYFGKEGRLYPEGRLAHLERQIKRIAEIIHKETSEQVREEASHSIKES